jgi:hypothetical protein
MNKIMKIRPHWPMDLSLEENGLRPMIFLQIDRKVSRIPR